MLPVTFSFPRCVFVLGHFLCLTLGVTAFFSLIFIYFYFIFYVNISFSVKFLFAVLFLLHFFSSFFFFFSFFLSLLFRSVYIFDFVAAVGLPVRAWFGQHVRFDH